MSLAAATTFLNLAASRSAKMPPQLKSGSAAAVPSGAPAGTLGVTDTDSGKITAELVR